MMRATLAELAAILGCQVPAGASQVVVAGVAFDSREVAPGNLFVAIPGEKTDGHLFLEEARRRGAAAALVLRLQPAALPQLSVPDTVAALQRLAAAEREKRQLAVAAVTGSVGKTTTKAMLAALLRTRFPVAETRLSRNSQVGLPAELLNLPEHASWFVAEAGMSHAGELDRLGRVLAPDALLYTRIAPVHLEFFPSLAAIAEAKAELIPHLKPEGVLVVNAADPWQESFPSRFSGRLRRYGAAGCDLWLASYRSRGLLGSQLSLQGPGVRFQATLPLPGRHQAENFLAAACLALELGVDPESIAATAATLAPQPHRGEVHQLANGAILVDDSYNASPAAVAAMLELLAETPGRKVAVLGEMLELGEQAEQFHRETGKRARQACEQLLAVGGENARALAEAFGPGAQWVEDVAAAIPRCRNLLEGGEVVLVKGSRGIGLDRLVAALLEEGR